MCFLTDTIYILSVQSQNFSITNEFIFDRIFFFNEVMILFLTQSFLFIMIGVYVWQRAFSARED